MRGPAPSQVLALGLTLLLAACSSGTIPPANAAPTLAVSPPSTTVTVGDGATDFTATLAHSSAQIAWTLNGPGSISSSSGTRTSYTPPASGGTATAALTATAGSLSATAVIIIEATSAASPQGVWQASSGDEVLDLAITDFPLQYLDLSDGGGSSDLRLQETGLSGSGGIYGASASTGVLACGDVIYGVLADDLLALYSTTALSYGSQLLRFTMPDANTLVLTSDAGRSQTFTRVSSVPVEARCGEVAVEHSFERIELPLAYRSNLLSDGTGLQVAGDDGKVYPVNPSNGQLGTGQDLATQYDHAFALQGSSYWGHCWCGNTTDVARVQPGGAIVDQISTRTDLGKFLGFSAGTWDGSHLWIYGYDFDDQASYLLEVDSDAEPDVLVRTLPFGANLQALTAHDGSLWGIVEALGPKLVQIDPATGKAVATSTLPPVSGGNGQYSGLAWLDSELWLLSDENRTFSLYRATP